MNFDGHPCWHIIEQLKKWPDAELEFSIYQYKPQTVLDQRTILNVTVADFSSEWVAEKIASLQAGEELAFHSKIARNKKISHIPMIDFECSLDEFAQAKSTLGKLLTNHILSGLVFYDSGRSLHAYGSCQLQKAKWVEFMGAVLLANLPGKSRIVDSRWVGHRLLGGFSSLRWSSKSDWYLKMPTKIKS